MLEINSNGLSLNSTANITIASQTGNVKLESSEDGQVELAGTLKVGKKAADDDSPEPISVDKNGTVEVSHCSIGNFPPNKCGLTDGSFHRVVTAGRHGGGKGGCKQDFQHDD